jgi:hypothetical protein
MSLVDRRRESIILVEMLNRLLEDVTYTAMGACGQALVSYV